MRPRAGPPVGLRPPRFLRSPRTNPSIRRARPTSGRDPRSRPKHNGGSDEHHEVEPRGTPAVSRNDPSSTPQRAASSRRGRSGSPSSRAKPSPAHAKRLANHGTARFRLASPEGRHRQSMRPPAKRPDSQAKQPNADSGSHRSQPPSAVIAVTTVPTARGRADPAGCSSWPRRFAWFAPRGVVGYAAGVWK
jgi:hypothetical protein